MAEIKITLVNGDLAGKTAQDIGKAVREAAKELSKAKVGTEEWLKANQKLEDAKQLHEDLQKQIKSTATSSDLLKKAWNNLPGASFFNQIGESFGMMKKGVGGLTSQFGVLKTAIAATGIGALVLLLTSLYTWFKKTDEGATKLDGIFRAIGATVDVFLNRIINLRKTITELWNNPGQFFRGLISDVKEAVEVGQELADTFDTLDQKRRDMELLDRAQSNQINQLLLQSKNVALSYQERLAILDKVDAIEQQNYQTKLQYAAQYLLAVNKETALMQKAGTITDEQLDKQNEARIAFLEVQNESITLQEKIENRRSQLLEKQNAENEKATAASVKRAEEERKLREQAAKEELDALRNIQDLKDSVIVDAQEREIEQIWTQTQRKIEALVGSEEQIAEQKALLQEQEILAVQAVVDKYAAEAKAKKDASDAQETAAKQAKFDKEKQLLEERAAFENSIAEAQNTVAKETFDFGLEVLNSTVKNEKAARNIRKAGALAEIGINLQREKSENAIVAARFAAGFPPGPAALAAYAGTLLKLNLGSNIRAALSAAKVLVFKKGGILQGPSHEQGGIGMMVRGRMVAEAEGGEPILTAAVSRNPVLLAAASRINVAAGGRPLMADGGVTPTTATGTTQPFDMAGFEERMAAIILSAMDKKITTLRVVNDPLQTQAKIDEIKQIENEVNV